MNASQLSAKYRGLLIIALLILGLFVGYTAGFYVGVTNQPTSRTLLVDAAGTLQVPFNRIEMEILKEQYPDLSYDYTFEGSRLAANEITQLNKSFDVFASADYRIIPEQLVPSHASWYIIFASNAMSVVYTNHSRYANEINAGNWYQVITRPGVIVGVSNKDTDPSGSNAIFMLELAGLSYYQNSTYLYDQLYLEKAAAKQLVIVPTETILDAQLETGSIDYELTYSSEAISHHYQYLNLGSKVDLSNLTLANWYSTVNTTVNGKLVQGAPILYDVTIPINSPDPAMATAFVKALFTPQGQQIIEESGFGLLNPVYVYNQNEVPSDIVQAITNSGIAISQVS
ncbi:MAG: extracellular solute-binding protein [Candidatus Bathyarchaeia archaeon]